MSVSELSASTQNYLKAVWGLAEWSSAPVTPTQIAHKTGLKLSSVSDAVRKLSSQGLLTHTPYGAVELTPTGRAHALAMVRRHRLIESFLVTVLGYRWDQVHDEADNLEHAVSDFMVERMEALLGFPTHDPHGDPIPASDGTLPAVDATQLTLLGTDIRVLVERLSDADPALLQYFEAHGVTPGARLTVSEGPPFSDALEVRVEGTKQTISLGRAASDALYASVIETPAVGAAEAD